MRFEPDLRCHDWHRGQTCGPSGFGGIVPQTVPSMSMRLEMLQVARLAPKVLGESAELVRDFVLKQQNDDGGFRDRAGKSDLYYTVFGLDGLLALDVASAALAVPRPGLAERFAPATRYLQTFDHG